MQIGEGSYGQTRIIFAVIKESYKRNQCKIICRVSEKKKDFEAQQSLDEETQPADATIPIFQIQLETSQHKN
ncbi:hypothetical protein F383_07225 [Gossypium arboreum]|uniref:Uncharacterized protein n=1 Tax=Gossypium arboreum TaxID=29729 RepID=A0A0B0PQ65_GOSAR|nr:hypothetical protein F383_07225 [Gossypium arboreum]